MLHSPPDALLARGFAAGLAARTERWRPGLSATCRHGEIFAPAAEASGAGLALALALDSFACAQFQSGGLALDKLRRWSFVVITEMDFAAHARAARCLNYIKASLQGLLILGFAYVEEPIDK